ncbi:E3 ubiquitin-protein ligase WAV3-like [Phoenix dactylifera]|uniref:E3 ubiquitin-protein ligase WAV3-like n=1 Tax=Phoenix dactylifera TaxID=42345 RepID=A0A8B7C4A0_PHODC|nr:E3 ubiquitin-protein ligase WAV3-like [Phoenix dactylifera]
MGTGWRRAFCTSIRRDSDMAVAEKSPDPNRSRRSCAKLSFFSGSSGSSNPSTPRLGSLRCRTKSTPSESPKLQCKTATVASSPTPPPRTSPKRSPTLFHRGSSKPSSPRSRSTFALLKAAVHLSRIRCGICEQSVKAGGGTAVFTAECSHVFHFPCIAAHVRTHGGGGGTLGCPVCSAAWRQAPFLSSLRHLQDDEPQPPVLVGDRKPLHCRRMSREDKQCGSGAETRPVSAAAAVHKVYDDDEPPLLPTKPSQTGAGVRFNPIPEANEDDESGGNEDDELEPEGEEKFHDFSAKDNNNGNRSLFPSYKVSVGPMRACAGGVQVRMMPEAALVSSGRRHRNYVVALKVKAPAVAPLLSRCRRAPIDLVTVLDVGGGMTRAKIQMLKRAMRLVISSLGPADRLSVVAFSAAAAKRLLPLRRMSRSGQRSAWQIVERLVASTGGQGSCVGDALRKATKVLEDRRERNPVATIMLLSDVQQQQDAEKDGRNYRRYPSTASAATTRFAHLEIPIHETGFGNAPQQQLPSQISSQAAPVEHAFAKCVGGLVSVVLQDVLLQLFFPSGEVSAVYSCGGGRAVALGSSVRLGDLYAEEERELLVELRVPTAAGPDHHQHSLSVKCTYRDPATQEVIGGGERSLLLPPLQGHPQLARSSSLISLRLRNLFVTTRAVAESRRLAELSDYATALHLLFSARSLLLQALAASDQDQDLIRRLEAEISDLQQRREGQQQQPPSPCQRRRETAIPGGEQQLTPTSAWRAAEQLAKVAIMRKSLNRVSDLHGFENARF